MLNISTIAAGVVFVTLAAANVVAMLARGPRAAQLRETA
jgi:hypothetical protein